MAITAPPSIATLPAAPDPNDRASFNTRAYPWAAAQAVFGTEVSAVASNVYSNASQAETLVNGAMSAGLEDAAENAAIAIAKAAEAAASAEEVVVMLERFIGSLCVTDFGADLTGVTDSTAAIQAAINAVGGLASGGVVIFPPGFYRLSATLNNPFNNVSLIGAQKDAVIFRRYSDYGPTYSVTNGTTTPLSGGSIQNIWFIDMNDSMTLANSPFHIDMDNVLRLDIFNVTVSNGAGGVRLKCCNTIHIDNFQLGIYSGAYNGRNGINITSSAIVGLTPNYGSMIYITNSDLQCGAGLVASTNLANGLRVDCVDGLWVDNFHVFNSFTANISLNRTGANPISNVYITNTMLDHSNGFGLFIIGGAMSAIHFQGRASSLGLGGAGYHGIAITAPLTQSSIDASVEGYAGCGIYASNAAISDLAITPRVIRNNNANSGGGNAYGINIETCAARVTINGGTSGGDGKQLAGLNLGAGAVGVTVTGLSCTGNLGPGIKILSGASNYSIVGCPVTGNTGGSIIDSSGDVSKTIANNLGHNPIASTAITVTASPFSWKNTTGAAVTVIVSGGTVSDVSMSSSTLGAATNAAFTVPHGQALTTTYSSAPTMKYLGV